MTRPVNIKIDRLVLPASERGREAQFRAALENRLAAELGGQAVPGEASGLADRTATAIAAKVRGAQS